MQEDRHHDHRAEQEIFDATAEEGEAHLTDARIDPSIS